MIIKIKTTKRLSECNELQELVAQNNIVLEPMFTSPLPPSPAHLPTHKGESERMFIVNPLSVSPLAGGEVASRMFVVNWDERFLATIGMTATDLRRELYECKEVADLIVDRELEPKPL